MFTTTILSFRSLFCVRSSHLIYLEMQREQHFSWISFLKLGINMFEMGLDLCSCSFHFKRVRVCTCVDVKLCTHVEIIFNKVLYDMLKRQMRVPISQQWCYSLRCFFSRFLDVHKIFTCTMAYQHKKLANCKWIQMKYIFCTSHRRLTFRNFTFFRFLFSFSIWNLKFWFISCSMLLGWAVMYHKKKNKMRTDENVL